MMGRRAAVNVSVARGNEACPYGKSGMQRKKVAFFLFTHIELPLIFTVARRHQNYAFRMLLLACGMDCVYFAV
jgi:hypothetical protein